jgi:prepilin-type processing-associated H-X9-DG protein
VLIVIVIIAVLAAIMIPLIRGVREKARAAVCAQNLKQIGIGLHAYISENSGRFPDGSADVSWIGKGICWYDAAAQGMGRDKSSTYYNDPEADLLPDAFGCPSGHGEAYYPEWPYTGDYAANWHLGNNSEIKTISALKNPSSTPYVQDTVCQNNFGSGVFNKGASKKAWKNTLKTSDPDFADRHGGSGNILWVDGHVSSFKYSEYMDFAISHGGAYNFARGKW